MVTDPDENPHLLKYIAKTRMHERSMGLLIERLRSMGYEHFKNESHFSLLHRALEDFEKIRVKESNVVRKTVSNSRPSKFSKYPLIVDGVPNQKWKVSDNDSDP